MDFFRYLGSNKTYVAALGLALVLALVVTPVVIRVARRFGIVDRPDYRKVHRRPVPLLGGVAIYIGMWVPILLLGLWDNAITDSLAGRWADYGILAGTGLVMLITGVIDDKRGLNAWQKLAVEIPLAVVFAVGVRHFQVINLPGITELDLGMFGIPITVLWIIGSTNALNLIDGIDGLATGVAIVIALTNAVLAIHTRNPFLALVMLGMAGACLGFLRYNFAPARIYLGDAGSLFLGFTLAASSILASSKSHMGTSMLVAVIVLGYPILDTLLAVVRRSLLGRPVMSSDKGHIHHRLLQMGFSHRRAAMVLYIFTAGLSVLALAIVLKHQTIMLMAMLGLSGVGILGLNMLGFFRPFLPSRIQISRPLFQIAHHQGSLIRAKMAITGSLEGIIALVREACEALSVVEMTIELDPHLRQESGDKDTHHWRREDQDIPDALVEVSLPTGVDGFRIRVTLDLGDLEPDLAIEHQAQLSQVAEVAGHRMQRILTGHSSGEWPLPQLK